MKYLLLCLFLFLGCSSFKKIKRQEMLRDQCLQYLLCNMKDMNSFVLDTFSSTTKKNRKIRFFYSPDTSALLFIYSSLHRNEYEGEYDTTILTHPSSDCESAIQLDQLDKQNLIKSDLYLIFRRPLLYKGNYFIQCAAIYPNITVSCQISFRLNKNKDLVRYFVNEGVY